MIGAEVRRSDRQDGGSSRRCFRGPHHAAFRGRASAKTDVCGSAETAAMDSDTQDASFCSRAPACLSGKPVSRTAEGLQSTSEPIAHNPARPLQVGTPAGLCAAIIHIDPEDCGRGVSPVVAAVRSIEQGRIERKVLAIIVGYEIARGSRLSYRHQVDQSFTTAASGVRALSTRASGQTVCSLSPPPYRIGTIVPRSFVPVP